MSRANGGTNAQVARHEPNPLWSAPWYTLRTASGETRIGCAGRLVAKIGRRRAEEEAALAALIVEARAVRRQKDVLEAALRQISEMPVPHTARDTERTSAHMMRTADEALRWCDGEGRAEQG